MATLMLIDGNSLTYRAFFALPTDMATASGQVTNAAFGFTSMLLNLVRDHSPDLVGVTFDRPEPTFRHEMVTTYKANREAAPDILRQQMGLVRQLVETLGLPIVEKVGFEADDVIATLATRGAAEGLDVLIVTGDRDSYQLVSDPHIKVLYNRRGVSDYALYDEAGIFERTGVRPDQYVFYAAMRGDPSDNLPGIPGVGEKTAAKLIAAHGDLDGIFAHLDEQTPKLRQNLSENEAQARSNVEMMRLVRDVELDVGPGDLVQAPFEIDEVVELFKFLEFSSLIGRLGEAFGERGRAGARRRGCGDRGGDQLSSTPPVRVLRSMRCEPTVSPSPSRRVGRDPRVASPLVGLALVTDASGGEVAWLSADVIGEIDAELRSFLTDGPSVVAHDAKPLVRSLLSIDMAAPVLALDTKLAAYLLDPADTRYELNALVVRYCASGDGDERHGDGSRPTRLRGHRANRSRCRRVATPWPWPHWPVR